MPCPRPYPCFVIHLTWASNWLAVSHTHQTVDTYVQQSSHWITGTANHVAVFICGLYFIPYIVIPQYIHSGKLWIHLFIFLEEIEDWSWITLKYVENILRYPRFPFLQFLMTFLLRKYNQILILRVTVKIQGKRFAGWVSVGVKCKKQTHKGKGNIFTGWICQCDVAVRHAVMILGYWDISWWFEFIRVRGAHWPHPVCLSGTLWFRGSSSLCGYSQANIYAQFHLCIISKIPTSALFNSSKKTTGANWVSNFFQSLFALTMMLSQNHRASLYLNSCEDATLI